MRSPRCAGCRLLVGLCICGELAPLSIATPLVIFVHALEVARPSNTAWLVGRVVSSAEVHVHGRAGVALPVVPPARWLALRPEGRRIEARDAGAGLLLADGTWSQARHMNQRIPALRDAEPVRLEGAAAVPRVRRASGDRLCTAEAVARALALLGEGEASRRLLLAATTWAERTLLGRQGTSQ
jgi:DTW domain-containing protein